MKVSVFCTRIIERMNEGATYEFRTLANGNSPTVSMNIESDTSLKYKVGKAYNLHLPETEEQGEGRTRYFDPKHGLKARTLRPPAGIENAEEWSE